MTPAHPTNRDERGIALLIVLMTITLLTIVVVEFTESSEVATHFALSERNATQAFYLARSGINVAEALIAVDTKLNKTDSDADVWAGPYPPLPIGDGTAVLRVQDEGRRLNLNLLSRGRIGGAEPIFRNLFRELGADQRVLSAIIDWVDADLNTYPDPPGAEQSAYLDLTPPVFVPNLPMLTMGELRQVRGMTPSLFARLQDFVTVLPLDSDKINVNTAPAEVVMALSDRLDQGVVDRLIATRREEPFSSPNDVGKLVPGWSDAFSDGKGTQFVDVKSTYFRIDAVGQVNDVVRGIFAIVKRDPTAALRPRIIRTYWAPSTANLSLTSQPPSDFLDTLPPLGGKT